MGFRLRAILGALSVFAALLLLHLPLLRLPYFWDEAGYYIPAALDFYHRGLLIPQSTLPTGHTPLVMIYLGLVWHVFGFSPLVTRSAMILVAATTVICLYGLGRQVAGREVAIWSAVLLALCPLFFAQSSLAHLDLAAGLFTTLAVLALLRDRTPMYVLAASLAIFTKETTAVMLPLVWLFAWWRWRRHRELRPRDWILLASPLLPLLAWACYFHYTTGYWTGNREYLEYNLYSTLTPLRFLHTMPRRIEKVFISGFNWVLVMGALGGYWWKRNKQTNRNQRLPLQEHQAFHSLLFLWGGLMVSYLLMLSLVGGAVLPRYLLPIFPVFFLVCVALACQLPRTLARTLCSVVVACFVASWFINPPWAFPFEDNLSYADFVQLHQQAAGFLQTQARELRILTAWPASDELARPFLGYVNMPLRTVPLQGFTADDFAAFGSESFDFLYLYSRKWTPRENWFTGSPLFRKLQQRFPDEAPSIPEELLVARYRLTLAKSFERRGQWVRIYSKRNAD